MSLVYVLKVPIHNNLVLVKMMAWRRPGDKLSYKLRLALITNVYMWHFALVI